MKRLKFIRYLDSKGCFLIREGQRHSVFYNPRTGWTSTVPRHSEVNDFLVKKICRDLGIK